MSSKWFNDKIEEIRRDSLSGAEELLVKCLSVLEKEFDSNISSYQTKEQIFALIEMMGQIRDEMAIFDKLRIMLLEEFEKGTQLSKIPTAILNRVIENKHLLVEHAINHIQEKGKIITISRSSSLYAIFEKMKNRKELPLVFLSESRPDLEGKIFADELLDMGYSVIYYVDAAISTIVEQYKPDIVIIGADTILQNGDVINKIGSKTLAVAAKALDIPFYVVSTTHKLLTKQKEILLEIYDGNEVYEGKIPVSLTVHNQYFETVPNNLITGYITEQGISSNIPLVYGKDENNTYDEG